MSSFDFILDGMRWSYSAVSCYENCPQNFKLGYIEYQEHTDNFYSQYGHLVHECMRAFFDGKKKEHELAFTYEELYDNTVVGPMPRFPVGIGDKYRDQGYEFFSKFKFDLSKFDILMNEGKVEFEERGMRIIARPDLVLREKETGVIMLVDYKTSAPYRIDSRTQKEVVDKKKLEGYQKQLHLYTYALRKYANIPVDKTVLWFPRISKVTSTPFDLTAEAESIKWFFDTIEKIKADEDFQPNLSKENEFFCWNICDVRAFCKWRN